MFRFGILVSVLCCALSGCADETEVTALQKQTSDLQKQTKDLQAQVKELTESLDKVKADREFDKFMRDVGGIAYLTPGTDGYTVVESDLGHLTVQLSNIQAYANGSRVMLRFGNLTSATIDGAKATIEWGKVDEKGSPKNDEARSREIKFDKSLRAGAWTDVNVVLEGVPPQEFGFVRVKDVAHTGIHLSR